jgi:DNA-3-methyladenine glycosylase
MPFEVLPLDFYGCSTQTVARELLGKLLVRTLSRRRLIGRIVETEAYLAKGDTACHAARGRTKSNAAMFGPPGRAYVYPIHSRHCFNIVTEADGVGAAVLIRAVEPIEGIDLMQEHRDRDRRLELTRGPGRLCQAFAIDRHFDHWNLTKGRQLWLADDGTQFDEKDAGISTRIGVTSGRELPLRFFLRDCPYVSGPQRLKQ